MEDLIQSYITTFCLGIGGMISLYNLGVSTKYYFTRNYGKVSDMFRIICNYGIFWQFALLFGYYATPSQVSLVGCQALGYLYAIGKAIFRISFAAYLLWRLRLIEKKRKDSVIGLDSDPGISPTYFCDYEDNQPTTIITWCSIILDFIIYTYATIRFIQILRHNSNQVESETGNDINEITNSRVKMINWSLILASLSFLLVWFEFLDNQSDAVTGGSLLVFVLKTLMYIVLSFVITIDNEIRPTDEVPVTRTDPDPENNESGNNESENKEETNV
ncbi:1_t:CDS:2 [Dentiscutata erythropus]|uniref:1_t:CDS:1 n=1 Tax=Dentiscutata erythropus TaxID=1348616 RepID=A0A9N9ADG6_9GLOM|nr:1_t:CDS:2 [Dentiscutata erythropus]